MLRARITPCLLVHKGGLYKTVGFKDPKYVGDPLNAVKIFNEKETDEIVVLDIDATTEGREPNFKLISHLALECRMPLCYGGGVKRPDQAKQIIGLGVEKVAISSAAVETPELVTRIAEEIGRQSVVTVLDVRRNQASGHDEVWTRNGTHATGLDPVTLAAALEARGAGEIVINSIDRDGAMKGYDLDLARRVKAAITIPLTVLGGAGSLRDVAALIEACGVVGAAAGSLFVFKGPFRAVLINYPNPAQKEPIVRGARA
jgi:imidazole glycerol-phosphate synthase subunit HisF